MIVAIPATLILIVAMLLPHLPGRYDASAVALSFVAQVACYTSLLLVPVGLVWMANRSRGRSWQRLALVVGGCIALVSLVAAAAVNHLALGVILGVVQLLGLWTVDRRMRAASDRGEASDRGLPQLLVGVPILLVAFMAVVMPRAAAWSRTRAIEHAAALIAEIELSQRRRGYYPPSLQSLNRDVPTGVVGIERFHYEPNGEGYNLFFIRPALSLDAAEVVMYNPRGEHRFASHELDLLQFDGAALELRRGDRRRTPLAQEHWVSILFE